MSDSNPPRTAFKVRIGDYLTEHELEGLGISADWFLYLSPTIAPALATSFTQLNTYDLLSCPCCGGAATIIGTYPTNEFSAICRDCGLETAHKMMPSDAARGWNKRYAPDEGPTGIKTPEPNPMAALRAQPAGGGGGECESCEGKGFVVRYHDPYNRGDVSSPYDAPCGDCATPPESGGQGEAVLWQWRKKGDAWRLSYTFDHDVFATTDDSEVRALYTHPPAQASGQSVAQGQGFVMVPRVPTEAMRAVLTKMLTNCHSVSESYADLLAAAPAQPDGVGK